MIKVNQVNHHKKFVKILSTIFGLKFFLMFDQLRYCHIILYIILYYIKNEIYFNNFIQ